MAGNNKISDTRSINELKKLFDYCNKMILKNNEEASKYETIESSTSGYKLIVAVLKADTLDDYDPINDGELSEIDSLQLYPYKFAVIGKDNLNEEQKEIVLEYKRFKLYTLYMQRGDLNPYYERIYQNYIKDNEPIITNFSDFLVNASICFYVYARMCSDFQILYSPPGILDDIDKTIFKQCYTDSLNYFMKVLYNEAYLYDNEKYPNFCMVVIITMSIQRFLNKRIEEIDNIDFFDEYSIRNLFLSYGLDYFSDMPLKYQKRLLKNINELIKSKGTDKAIVSILKLFGFESIKIMRYVLCKKYRTKEDGTIDIENDPELKFLTLSSDYSNIEEAIINSTERSYDDVTSHDPYWQITDEEKAQLLKENFNYLNTKYLDVSSVIDLLKYSLDFSYFINLLFTIETKYKDKNNVFNLLYFYNYEISDKKINLCDAIILLQTIIMKKFNLKDNIITSETAIQSVYNFNFDENKISPYNTFHLENDSNNEETKIIMEEYPDINWGNDKNDLSFIDNDGDGLDDSIPNIDSTQNKITFHDKLAYYNRKLIESDPEWKHIEEETIKKYKENNMSLLNDSKNMERTQLNFLFLNNKKFKAKLEEEILKTKNYKDYKELKHFYNICFYSKFRRNLFNDPETNTPFETYSKWLKYRDPKIYKYLKNLVAKANEQETETELIYDEAILNICNSIDNFINNDEIDFFLQGNIYLINYISEFVFQLVNFIKSYTVHINQLSTIYTMDNKFLNSILYFDEAAFKVTMSNKQLFSIIDEKEFYADMTIDYEQLLIKEKDLLFKASMKFIDKEKLKDKFDIGMQWYSFADLLDITTEDYKTYITETLIDGYDLKDKLIYETVINNKTNLLIKDSNKEDLEFKEMTFNDSTYLPNLNKELICPLSVFLQGDKLYPCKEKLIINSYDKFKDYNLDIDIYKYIYEIEQHYVSIDLSKNPEILEFEIDGIFINDEEMGYDIDDTIIKIYYQLKLSDNITIRFKNINLKNVKEYKYGKDFNI